MPVIVGARLAREGVVPDTPLSRASLAPTQLFMVYRV